MSFFWARIGRAVEFPLLFHLYLKSVKRTFSWIWYHSLYGQINAYVKKKGAFPEFRGLCASDVRIFAERHLHAVCTFMIFATWKKETDFLCLLFSDWGIKGLLGVLAWVVWWYLFYYFLYKYTYFIYIFSVKNFFNSLLFWVENVVCFVKTMSDVTIDVSQPRYILPYKSWLGIS